MMTQHGHEFEPDELRAALRRAFPAERAPQALRDRVAAMLRNEEVFTSDADAPAPVKLTQPAGPVTSPAEHPEYAHTPIAWLGNFFHGARRVALAACFAGLAMGIAIFVTLHTNGDGGASTGGSGQVAAAEGGQIPPFVQAALVRHDELQQPADAGRSASTMLRPLPQVRTEVQKHIATPVPDPDIATQGWQLVGAKTCQAASGLAAQIFYRRDKDTLSVFIVPPDSDGRRIRMSSSVLRNHLVATRDAEKFTVCVVGTSPDGKLTAQEVDRVADLIARH